MWIKTSKAAKILDVSGKTIVKYIKEGLIRGKQLPGSTHWRVWEEDVKNVFNNEIDIFADSLLRRARK